jgi:lipoprotein-anchoring transpeptidase ErfK/SrfK
MEGREPVGPPATNTPPSKISTQIVFRAVPVSLPMTNPVAAPKSAAIFEAQISLDRLGISSGSIDGVAGSQTRAALRAFQSREGLPPTGELDTETRGRIPSGPTVTIQQLVQEHDLTRLLPVATTWLGKSEQPRLDFETALEAIAEKNHAHPNLLRRLNPATDWTALQPGMELVVPATGREAPRSKAAYVQIRLAERTLQAYDASNHLIAHFPCSIAHRAEKRPVGELHVAVIAPNPNYTFDPAVFPESAEAREIGRKLILPPGPNNPVGTVWIGLDKPGYGIHGTPKPEDVGRTESHGCFRLANWNAEYLLQLVTVGTVVRVEP